MNSLQKLIENQQRQGKNRYYAGRKDATLERCNHEEFNKILDTVKDKYTKISKTTIRNKIPPKSFSLCYYENTQRFSLFVYEDNKHIKQYVTAVKDAKNENKQSVSPMKLISKDFKERTNKSLIEAFGAVKQDFKVCVPSPITYRSPLFPLYKEIKHVNYEDYSSHYPACANKLLPDANTAVKVNKYAKPDEEYRFCFYPETGHIAVYDEFDTHDYIRAIKIYGASDKNRAFKTDYMGHETYTIKMKASKEKIVELEAYYDRKNRFNKDTEEYKTAKLVLNKFLGMFEQNSIVCYKQYPLAHLAAVIKWRANVTTLELIKRIGPENVIQACVDGIIHIGKVQGTNIKKLGNLITEEIDAKFIQRGINQYIIFGKETHVCHQGLDINTDSKNIKDWEASPKTNYYKFITDQLNAEVI